MVESLKAAITTVVAVYVLTVLKEGSCCEMSWIRFGDSCYKIFSKSGNIGYTKYSGRFKCLLEGSDLASISNISVLDFLAQHVVHSEASKFWVGLSSQLGSTELVWYDGTRGAKEQPWVDVSQLKKPPGPYLMNCYAYNGAKVEFTPCVERIGAICSYKIANRTVGGRRCHWKESYLGETTGNCLHREEVKARKNMVNKICEQERAYFADVDDLFRDGLTALHNNKVLLDDGSKYWTGLIWNGSDLFWSNGNHVSKEYPIHVETGSGSCVTMQFNFSDALEVKFYQTECEDEAHFVCYSTPDGFTTISSVSTTQSSGLQDMPLMDEPVDTVKCPEGYNWKSDMVKGYCYWETSFETNQLSWSEAEAYCNSFGGHLCSFHSIEDERLGLSFQYGSLSHAYWIGLHFDPENETYKWSDGTPLDYTNWATGHPNHKDKQLQCVAMEAQAKYWVSALCGVLSWFVCKVPAKSIHQVSSVPTPIPLEPCERYSSSTIFPKIVTPPTYPIVHKNPLSNTPAGPSYFEGACYFLVPEAVSWHRAKQHCENVGATLVSIHSVEEIGFLLRLIHFSAVESNSVWIGLNSLGYDGNFRWTDWSGVDFTFFGENEPDNFQNQEKCCNMNNNNGEWSDENCNAAAGFICKMQNNTAGTPTIPSTPDPKIGNCKNGWIAHHDRCYYLGGKRKKDRVNWTDALDICQKLGGYLTSIRDEIDQTFLSYLLQILGGDAWIGLHDTIQSGRYYWLDNSEVRYTNWAPGEPSFFGIMEDCVKMVYDHLDSGVWKDEECGHEMGYICQDNKDPSLPPVPYEKGVNCPHPEGWLKLENMCFKMFVGKPLTWENAKDACKKEGGHLVSVSDQRVRAVVSYLASEVNQPFFIGLKYKKDSQKVYWLNDHVVEVTHWEKNEPSFLTEDTCFASTSEGYWKKTSCRSELPYACQISTAKPTKLIQYTGKCPPSSLHWASGSSSYCYMLDEKDRYDWFTANVMCFRYGSHLASIHSMTEIEDLKKLIKPSIRTIYIGLMRNKKGGYTWMDDSPVDFVNWEDQEPSNSEDQCVEMIAETMKWKVSPCNEKKNFVCKDRKDTIVHEETQAEKLLEKKKGLSPAAICAVVGSVLIGVALMLAAVLYKRRSSSGNRHFRRQFRDQSVSFENALYNVGTSSMEFQDDSNKNSL